MVCVCVCVRAHVCGTCAVHACSLIHSSTPSVSFASICIMINSHNVFLECFRPYGSYTQSLIASPSSHKCYIYWALCSSSYDSLACSSSSVSTLKHQQWTVVVTSESNEDREWDNPISFTINKILIPASLRAVADEESLNKGAPCWVPSFLSLINFVYLAVWRIAGFGRTWKLRPNECVKTQISWKRWRRNPLLVLTRV